MTVFKISLWTVGTIFALGLAVLTPFLVVDIREIRVCQRSTLLFQHECTEWYTECGDAATDQIGCGYAKYWRARLKEEMDALVSLDV